MTILKDQYLSGAMRAAQGGDSNAFRRLLKDCVPLTACIIRAQGVRGAAIDDVVQEVLLTIHRIHGTYDPDRPFLPWLRAIARRRAIDHLRRAARQLQEIYDPLTYEAETDTGPLPGHALETRERDAQLVSALARLTEGQRQAVEHLGLRELSLQEASLLTGRSKGSLQVGLHRAIKALRNTLTGDEKSRV
jgi:RNA polymerase sigma factor (sigma-70 family)